MRARGVLSAGVGETLILEATHSRRVVDAILTGVHEVSESHFRLLESFAERDLLRHALELARREGLRQHEFGDFCFIE